MTSNFVGVRSPSKDKEWRSCPLIPYCYSENNSSEIRCVGVQYPPTKSAGEKARDFISHFVRNMQITVIVSHPHYFWDSWDDLQEVSGWDSINLGFDREGFWLSDFNGAYRHLDLRKVHFEDCVPSEAFEYGAIAIFLRYISNKEITEYAGIALSSLPEFCSSKNSILLYADEDAFEIVICGKIESAIKRKFSDLVVKSRLEVVNTEWFMGEGIYQEWVDEGWAIFKKDWLP